MSCGTLFQEEVVMGKVFSVVALLVAILMGVSSTGFAHGEDVPGPNKGAVKMIGTNHVEVVPVGGNMFDVYLLDVDFKNPITKDSSVEMWLNPTGGEKITLPCKVVSKERFHCMVYKPDLKKKLDSAKLGKLMVRFDRAGAKGVAIYKWPVKAMKGSDSKADHSMHGDRSGHGADDAKHSDHSGH